MVAIYDPDTLQLTVKPVVVTQAKQTVKAIKDGHFDPAERKVNCFFFSLLSCQFEAIASMSQHDGFCSMVNNVNYLAQRLVRRRQCR